MKKISFIAALMAVSSGALAPGVTLCRLMNVLWRSGRQRILRSALSPG